MKFHELLLIEFPNLSQQIFVNFWAARNEQKNK